MQLSLSTTRSRQGSFDIPTVDKDSRIECARVKADRQCPLPTRPAISVVFDELCRACSLSLVDTLFGLRRPSAIFRAVVAIVVDAVNGMLLRRARSHVSEKRRKGFVPRVAYSNAPAAVAGVGLRASVIAPRAHVYPALILRCCACLFAGVSVLANLASARGVVAAPELNTNHNALIAAFATTPPRGASPLSWFNSYDCEVSVDLTCFVFDAARQLVIIPLSHDVTLLHRVALWLEPRSGNQPERGSFILPLRDGGGNA